MDELKEKTADLADHIEDIAETYYKLGLINAVEKASGIATSVIVGVALGVLGALFLVFLCIAGALWAATLVNSLAGGFLIIAAALLLVLLVLVLIAKKAIFSAIRNKVISKIYE